MCFFVHAIMRAGSKHARRVEAWLKDLKDRDLDVKDLDDRAVQGSD